MPLRRILACLLIALVAGAPARAEAPLSGVALVIGNSAYAHLPPLANATGDARAIEALLASLGFRTELAIDRDARRLRRDLDNFLDDARDAAVAVLYYAGHGVEAGGKNHLVPVDADLGALEAAADSFLSLADVMAQLEATVPVSIVILDACRDNPFPEALALRPAPGAAPVPLGTTGLAAARSLSLGGQSARPASAERFGTVVAFAAEPGATALDGPPGGHSPYAAAILRHLGAMAEAEFGLVMRMVAEEVWLRTRGQQRPWVNENLRRLLYFGAAPAAPEGPEGAILAERRQLLVTIADLPGRERALVRQRAETAGVPMDALFAMLAALGEDMPDDASALEPLLARLADDLRAARAQAATLGSTDPEIARLVALAETAQAEGALAASVAFFDAARARVADLGATLDRVEDDIAARRAEFAAVLAGAAEARALMLDFTGAAQGFLDAADQIARWDAAAAFELRLRAAMALVRAGTIRGDTPALERAVAQLRALGPDTPAQARARDAALAAALHELGLRQIAPDSLRAAVTLLDALLADADAQDQRAALLRRKGAVLAALGGRSLDRAERDSAVQALTEALALLPHDTPAAERAALLLDLGRAAALRAAMLGSDALTTHAAAAEAEAHLIDALALLDPSAHPLPWAQAQIALGRYGWPVRPLSGESLPDALRARLGAFDAAQGVCARADYPVCWAQAELGRGEVLYRLGRAKDDRTEAFRLYRRSLAALQAALAETRLELSPVDWAEALGARGDMLAVFATESAGGIALIYHAEAARAYRTAIAAITPQDLPALWLDLHGRLVRTLDAMGQTDHNQDRQRSTRFAAAEAWRTAMAALDPNADPVRWFHHKRWLGDRLSELAQLYDDDTAMAAALAAFDRAATALPRHTAPHAARADLALAAARLLDRRALAVAPSWAAWADPARAAALRAEALERIAEALEAIPESEFAAPSRALHDLLALNAALAQRLQDMSPAQAAEAAARIDGTEAFDLPAQARALRARARLLTQAGELAAAVADLRAALHAETAPATGPDPFRLALTHRRLAEALQMLNDSRSERDPDTDREAADRFDRARALIPPAHSLTDHLALADAAAFVLARGPGTLEALDAALALFALRADLTDDDDNHAASLHEQGVVLTERTRRSRDPADAARARAAFDAALALRPADAFPQHHAQLLRLRAGVDYALTRDAPDDAMLLRAMLATLERAAGLVAGSDAPEAVWNAESRCVVGRDLALLAYDPARVTTALAACAEAVAGYGAQGWDATGFAPYIGALEAIRAAAQADATGHGAAPDTPETGAPPAPEATVQEATAQDATVQEATE
ncbi:MAG: caspase family protein [Rhodobacteraceae bacterium]|nr:caspase family protein [Paracoccaceae bacterium]